MSQQQVTVTADDRGPLLNVATWLCIAGAVCLVVTKISMKWLKFRSLQGDDLFAILSLVLNTGLAIVASFQVKAGAGQHSGVLTMAKLVDFQKTEYATELLYICSVTSSKMLSLYFLMTLALDQHRRYAVICSAAFNALFMIASLFTLAFQCHLPPWRFIGGKCIDRAAFWYAYSILDILIELALTALPIYIIHKVQLQRAKRIKVFLAFSTRFFMIPAVAVRIVFITRFSKSSDPTWAAYQSSLLTQICANLSLALSCLTFVKPFLDSINTGMLSTDVRNRDINKSAIDSGRARLQFALDAIGFGSIGMRSAVGDHGASGSSRSYGLKSNATASRQRAESEEAILDASNRGFRPAIGEEAPHPHIELDDLDTTAARNGDDTQCITKTTDIKVFRS